MSLFRSLRDAGYLFAVLGLAFVVLAIALLNAPTRGDDKVIGPAQAAAPVVRQVYTTHGRSAKELANALIPHFKTVPSFLVLPVTGSKTLVLSGPKAVVQEAIALLREIDRPAQTIHVEVLLVELTGKAAGGAVSSGPIRDVMANVRDLEQRGVISSIHRVAMTVLERENVRLQTGENKPYVTGMTGTRGQQFGGGQPGPVSRSLTYRNVGTLVQVMKPEISADGRVELQLQIEDSQMRTPGGGPDIGTDEKGAPVGATEFVNTNFEAALRIPLGHFIVAESSQTSSKGGQGQKIILVGASFN